MNNGSRLAAVDSILLLVRGSELHNRIPVGIATCPVAFNQDVKALQTREGLLPEFLLYWLLGNEKLLLSKVEETGIGAGKLDTDVLKRISMHLPCLAEQRSIVHILGALDDRIELNWQMNATLESMARALFKSWFIDFDPVRAKSKGSDPGLPADIAALFPDSFEDSDLGEIPKGWAAGGFGNLISQRTERLRDRSAVVLSAMAAGELVSSDEHFTKRVYSQEIGKYLAVEQWDFAYNPSRVNIGSIGMLKEPLLGGVSPVYVVFRPQAAYRWFVEFNLRQPSTKQWISTLASGSVRQSLSYADFASLPCVIPPETIIPRFDEVWTGLRAGILSRSDESRTLTALRDTLLPKLLSGELRVKNVGQSMEAHA